MPVMVLCVCLALFASSHGYYKRVTLTPDNSSIDGATVHVFSNGGASINTANNEWWVKVASMYRYWALEMSLDSRWGLHPSLPSNLTITIDGSTTLETTNTDLDLLFSFSVNREKYWLALLQADDETTYNNRIGPRCDTNTEPTSSLYSGNIQDIVAGDSVWATVAGVWAETVGGDWQPPHNVIAWPVQFKIINDPSNNNMFVQHIQGNKYTQQCGFGEAFGTEQGLQIYSLSSSLDQTPEFVAFTSFTIEYSYDDTSAPTLQSTRSTTSRTSRPPTLQPTPGPTSVPTKTPTTPSKTPTKSPAADTTNPTKAPKMIPTLLPTVAMKVPTPDPTKVPSNGLTAEATTQSSEYTYAPIAETSSLAPNAPLTASTVWAFPTFDTVDIEGQIEDDKDNEDALQVIFDFISSNIIIVAAVGAGMVCCVCCCITILVVRRCCYGTGVNKKKHLSGTRMHNPNEQKISDRMIQRGNEQGFIVADEDPDTHDELSIAGPRHGYPQTEMTNVMSVSEFSPRAKPISIPKPKVKLQLSEATSINIERQKTVAAAKMVMTDDGAGEYFHRDSVDAIDNVNNSEDEDEDLVGEIYTLK